MGGVRLDGRFARTVERCAQLDATGTRIARVFGVYGRRCLGAARRAKAAATGLVGRVGKLVRREGSAVTERTRRLQAAAAGLLDKVQNPTTVCVR